MNTLRAIAVAGIGIACLLLVGFARSVNPFEAVFVVAVALAAGEGCARYFGAQCDRRPGLLLWVAPTSGLAVVGAGGAVVALSQSVSNPDHVLGIFFIVLIYGGMVALGVGLVLGFIAWFVRIAA